MVIRVEIMGWDEDADEDFQLTSYEWKWFMEDTPAFDVKSGRKRSGWAKYSIAILLEDGVELFDVYDWDSVMRVWK